MIALGRKSNTALRQTVGNPAKKAETEDIRSLMKELRQSWTPPEPEPVAGMEKGTIEKFIISGGFGFVRSDDNNKYFFHIRECNKNLRPGLEMGITGQDVVYHLKRGSKGKKEAYGLEVQQCL